MVPVPTEVGRTPCGVPKIHLIGFLLLLTSFSHQLVKRGQVVVLLQTKKDAEASSKHKHFTVKQRAVNTKPERIPCQAPVTFHSLTLCGP